MDLFRFQNIEINNIYGLCRSILAFSLLTTLISNPNHILFSSEGTSFLSAYVLDLSRFSIFWLFQSYLNIIIPISVIILVLVIIGWRPRYTVLFHWWITNSFFISCPVIDGGDQVSAILTLLIIPFGLSDNRKWHWQKPSYFKNHYLNTINHFAYISIRIQASIIYFFAATSKFNVPEWKNGTVLYYWFNHPTFGLNWVFKYFLDPLLYNSVVALFSWSVLLLEILLAMTLLASKKYWKMFLIIGILFHFFIFLFHGLFNFFLAMTALLILYLRPNDRPIDFSTFLNKENKKITRLLEFVQIKK